MPDYPDLADMDHLWPDRGYAVIVEDEMKPPDSEEFVTVLNESDTPNFELPPERPSYAYWVHDAAGNTYTRAEWEQYRDQHTDPE